MLACRTVPFFQKYKIIPLKVNATPIRPLRCKSSRCSCHTACAENIKQVVEVMITPINHCNGDAGNGQQGRKGLRSCPFCHIGLSRGQAWAESTILYLACQCAAQDGRAVIAVFLAKFKALSTRKLPLIYIHHSAWNAHYSANGRDLQVYLGLYSHLP